MSILLCNMGSREIAWGELPEITAKTARARGQQLLAQLGALAPRVRLPMVGKALRSIQGKGAIDQVILIASDQGDAPASEDERAAWESDTISIAQAVARLLALGVDGCAPIAPERIAVWLIGEGDAGRDPSDYDGVRRFLEGRLPALARQHPDAPAYLEVTGGTPAMSIGLLIAGSAVFGERATALYIQERYERPATLNTSRRLAAGPLRSSLRSHARSYDYGAALALLKEHQGSITDRLHSGAAEALEALLSYASCRFNFDFPGAHAALGGDIDRAGDGRWRAELLRLHDEVARPDRETTLAEVYYGAAARFDTCAWADFLTQVVRFQENAFRTMCLQRGARFVDFSGKPVDDGAKLDMVWAAQIGFTPRSDMLGRTGMERLIEHLARRSGEDIHPTMTLLGALEGLARLRNGLTHSLRGVHESDLAQAFSGRPAPEILPHLADCLTALTGRAPSATTPFQRVNGLIDQLLTEVF